MRPRILDFARCCCAILLLAFAAISLGQTSVEQKPFSTGQQFAGAVEPAATAGIGVALKNEKGKVLIGSVLPDTAASRTNALKPNDQITAIAEGNEEPVDIAGLDFVKVVGLIRGREGTVVRLTVIPEGKAEADARVISITRGRVKELDVFGDGKLLSLGTAALDFTFTQLLDGRDGNLSQLLGKVVVIDVWASWCKPCIKHIGDLESLKEEHPEWNGRIVLLAVSMDEKKEDAVNRCRAEQWTKITPVWTGPSICKGYHISGLPIVYIIDQKGVVVAAGNRLDIELLKHLLASDGK